jgi:plasmid stabilization system protein ParE
VARGYRILWAPIAAQDLDDIIDYIAAQDGPDAAVRVYDKVKKRTRTLSTHPRRCRIVPELRSVGVMEYRELIVSPYRVFFRIDGQDVGIIGVLDGRRDLEETLIRRAMH